MVEIETILQFEEVQGLLESAQGSGAVDTAELNAVVEALELDSVETEALLYELEQRGIELVEHRVGGARTDGFVPRDARHHGLARAPRRLQ